jgi:hypothetical protein
MRREKSAANRLEHGVVASARERLEAVSDSAMVSAFAQLAAFDKRVFGFDAEIRTSLPRNGVMRQMIKTETHGNRLPQLAVTAMGMRVVATARRQLTQTLAVAMRIQHALVRQQTGFLRARRRHERGGESSH